MRKTLLRLQVLVTQAALTLVACVIVYGNLSFDRDIDREQAVYTNLSESFVSTPAPVAPAAPEPVDEDGTVSEYVPPPPLERFTVDWDALLGVNRETVGWIRIEDTIIDYPIVQTTNNSRYLKTAFDGKESWMGTLFIDTNVKVGSGLNNSDIITVHGHNFYTNTRRTEMFTTLKYYQEYSYFEKHPEVIAVFIDDNAEMWDVFAVVLIDIYSDDAELYGKFNFYSEEQHSGYMQMIKDRQLYDTGLSARYGQRILMLSTCVDIGKNFRLVVYAAERLETHS